MIFSWTLKGCYIKEIQIIRINIGLTYSFIENDYFSFIYTYTFCQIMVHVKRYYEISY